MTNIGNQLATPPEARWNELLIDHRSAVPWGTIHSVKGREFEAVVLVIPQQLGTDEGQRSCLDLWSDGVDGESRRVLYVGATRARRLLTLAVHESHASRVAGLLRLAEVPVTL
jgi:superfamily I DNA/RNA helicase